MTVEKFGYGTYTLVMKASASESGEAISGSITGSGPYLSLSATEIDVEMEGLASRSHLTQLTTWTDENTSQKSQVTLNGLPHSDFHTYKIVWAPKFVQFFRNDELIATHKKIVPSKPASFLLNHWGTNDSNWGGFATPGIDRYVYIKSLTYTPNLKKP